MKLAPKKVEVFLIEGSPSGLRYVDLNGKAIRAFFAPRASFKDLLARPELKKSGVYVLYQAKTDSEVPIVYIGQGEVLHQRLAQHSGEEFWTECIVFLAQNELLDKAAIGYLESALIRRGETDNIVEFTNLNTPSKKKMSESNTVVMEEFLEDIIFILTVLGYKLIRSHYEEDQSAQPELFINATGQTARGRETDEGFIVYKGSTARINESKSWESVGRKLRNFLLKKEVLVLHPTDETKYIFTQDYVFSSPSAAGGMVLGRSNNGRTEWKDKKGRTLKELQEKLDN